CISYKAAAAITTTTTTTTTIGIIQPGISQCHRVIVFPNKWTNKKQSEVSNPPKSGNRRTSQPTMQPTEPVN
uniref:Uncharacterized protein n=1 Tax=Glossina palpalis gambiensis TaxID=67801 RepID=A0A1B0AP55_9MUSC